LEEILRQQNTTSFNNLEAVVVVSASVVVATASAHIVVTASGTTTPTAIVARSVAISVAGPCLPGVSVVGECGQLLGDVLLRLLQNLDQIPGFGSMLGVEERVGSALKKKVFD
jgi:hypothetical protein